MTRTETVQSLLEQRVRYHGSNARLHGEVAVVDEVCGDPHTCDKPEVCDYAIRNRSDEHLRWVLRFPGGGTLIHVRRSSFTLLSEES